MSELVTLITCTGFRSEAFKLCHEYMMRQTYKTPLQWIVVSDQYSAAEVDEIKANYRNFELYAGPVKWEPGVNTHRFNMLEALKHVKGDKILIIEDEDYYKPTYIEEMVKLLDHGEIVGEANSKYYHLGIPGWKEMRNFKHASLCQTGIRSALLPLLKAAIDSGELYFDVVLWRTVLEKHIPCVLFSDVNLCIGMKAMPGRAGIGVGHKVKDYLYDSNMIKLQEWLGADAANYLPFIKKRQNDGREPGNITTTQRPSIAGTVLPAVKVGAPGFIPGPAKADRGPGRESPAPDLGQRKS